MAKLKNVITIQQGSNWKFALSIFDDELYKLKYLDFLENTSSLYTPEVKNSLQLILNANVDQSILKEVTLGIIGHLLSTEELATLNSIFKVVQKPNTTGKRVKIYLQIYQSPQSSKTMKFNYTANLSSEGDIYFDIPATETQKMVHKLNRNYTDDLLGFYTIELQDETSKEVIRLLDGDVIILRGAKDVCDL